MWEGSTWFRFRFGFGSSGRRVSTGVNSTWKKNCEKDNFSFGSVSVRFRFGFSSREVNSRRKENCEKANFSFGFGSVSVQVAGGSQGSELNRQKIEGEKGHFSFGSVSVRFRFKWPADLKG